MAPKPDTLETRVVILSDLNREVRGYGIDLKINFREAFTRLLWIGERGRREYEKLCEELDGHDDVGADPDPFMPKRHVQAWLGDVFEETDKWKVGETTTVTVRFTVQDHTKFKRIALEQGMSLSDVASRTIFHAINLFGMRNQLRNEMMNRTEQGVNLDDLECFQRRLVVDWVEKNILDAVDQEQLDRLNDINRGYLADLKKKEANFTINEMRVRGLVAAEARTALTQQTPEGARDT